VACRGTGTLPMPRHGRAIFPPLCASAPLRSSPFSSPPPRLWPAVAGLSSPSLLPFRNSVCARVGKGCPGNRASADVVSSPGSGGRCFFLCSVQRARKKWYGVRPVPVYCEGRCRRRRQWEMKPGRKPPVSGATHGRDHTHGRETPDGIIEGCTVNGRRRLCVSGCIVFH
jgi:hypothetical protein